MSSPAGKPVSTGRDLIPLMFGLADRETMTGQQLVALLGEMGIGASSARTLISRTVAWGGLTSTRTGRTASYRIGASIAARFEDLRVRAAPAEDWDGRFHAVLYSVPETDRAFRDRLRDLAGQLGYGVLRAGLMVHPQDRWGDLASHVGPSPAGASVRHAWLSFDLATSRQVAAEVWDLDAIAAAYRSHCRELAALARSASRASQGADVLRRYVEGVRPMFQTLYVDPNLPQALLPTRWSRAEATRELGSTVEAFAQAANARLVELGLG